MNSQRARHLRSLFIVVLLALGAALALPTVARGQDAAGDAMVAGHEALDRSQYRSAVSHFDRAAELAAAAGDEQARAEALYWQAFALQRLGGTRELKRAAEALLQLRELDMDDELGREARSLAARVKADLAQQGDASAAREMTQMLEQLDARMDNQEEKLIALQALMNMNPERALPILEKVLQNHDPDLTELRRQAVFLLAEGGAEGSEKLMIELARNDPDPEVRAQAVFWLGQAGSEESLEFFRQLIATETDPEIVQQAVFAISQMDAGQASSVLRDLVRDPQQSREVREMALFGLGQEGTAEDRAFLREVYADLDDPELKEHVLHAAAQDDDPATAEWLVGIAMNGEEDLEARKMALFWAGQQGLLPIARLDSVYTDVEDREMREQIIFVLSQDGSDEAIERLMAIAREEQDPELRKHAIFWIGQSGVEGAEDFLLEIINR